MRVIRTSNKKQCELFRVIYLCTLAYNFLYINKRQLRYGYIVRYSFVRYSRSKNLLHLQINICPAPCRKARQFLISRYKYTCMCSSCSLIDVNVYFFLFLSFSFFSRKTMIWSYTIFPREYLPTRVHLSKRYLYCI